MKFFSGIAIALVCAASVAPTAAFAASWTTVSVECPINDKITVTANGHSKHGAGKALQNAMDEVFENGYPTDSCYVV